MKKERIIPLASWEVCGDPLPYQQGKNWQRDYIVWDMCCGVGNLEVKHSNPRNIYMSTLDKADVDVMHATKTCVAATRFQYDYLNDDINEFGQIDYGLTNKVPQGLRDALAQGKKILVYLMRLGNAIISKYKHLMSLLLMHQSPHQLRELQQD